MICYRARKSWPGWNVFIEWISFSKICIDIFLEIILILKNWCSVRHMGRWKYHQGMILNYQFDCTFNGEQENSFLLTIQTLYFCKEKDFSYFLFFNDFAYRSERKNTEVIEFWSPFMDIWRGWSVIYRPVRPFFSLKGTRLQVLFDLIKPSISETKRQSFLESFCVVQNIKRNEFWSLFMDLWRGWSVIYRPVRPFFSLKGTRLQVLFDLIKPSRSETKRQFFDIILCRKKHENEWILVPLHGHMARMVGDIPTGATLLF